MLRRSWRTGRFTWVVTRGCVSSAPCRTDCGGRRESANGDVGGVGARGGKVDVRRLYGRRHSGETGRSDTDRPEQERAVRERNCSELPTGGSETGTRKDNESCHGCDIRAAD